MKAKWVWMVLAVALALPAEVAVAQETKAANPVVVIETNLGSIRVELFADKAPISVKNFLGYVQEDFYAGTIFHRVMKGFMIQGGGMTANMQRKATKPPIRNEATNGLSNLRGTIAMARTGEVNSATSQFYINTVDNKGLDHRGLTPGEFGYAVFGKVLSGMDVADKIEGTKTAPGDVPVQTITIKTIRLEK